MCLWTLGYQLNTHRWLAASLVAGASSGNWTQEQGLVGRQEIGRRPSRSPPRPVFDISVALPSYTAFALSVNCPPFAPNIQSRRTYSSAALSAPTLFVNPYHSLPSSSLHARNTLIPTKQPTKQINNMFTKASVVAFLASAVAAQHAPVGEPLGNPITRPLIEVSLVPPVRPV
jgi:hypothetical protein